METAQDAKKGWREYKTSEGKVYYHHEGTGQTTWKLPPGESLESRTDAGVTRPDLPAGWKEYLTKEGRTAFFHAATRKTTYIRPGQTTDSRQGQTTYTRPGQTTYTRPGPATEGSCSLAKRAKVDEESERSIRKGHAEALRRAAYQGSVPKVKEALAGLSLVERLLTIDEADEDDGHSALHLAAIQGYDSVVEYLIKQRADIDCISTDGNTPLMWAAHQGNLATVQILVKLGANVLLENKRGQDCAKQTNKSRNIKIFELLDNRKAAVVLELNRRNAKLNPVRHVENETMTEAERTAANSGQPAANGGDADSDPLASLPTHVRQHYVTLRLPASASLQDVRQAYKQLVHKHHPDKNPGAEVQAKRCFDRIAVAYEAVCEHLARTSVTSITVNITHKYCS